MQHLEGVGIETKSWVNEVGVEVRGCTYRSAYINGEVEIGTKPLLRKPGVRNYLSLLFHSKIWFLIHIRHCHTCASALVTVS